MWDMKLITILIALCACQTNGISHITYDWTDQLNEISTGNISVEEFAKDLNSIGNGSSQLLGLYSSDCKVILECENQIYNVVKKLHEAQALMLYKVDITLKLKFTIYLETLVNLKSYMSQSKLNFPAGKYYAYFTLPDETTCEDLKTVTIKEWEAVMNRSTWFSLGSAENVLGVGFGFNEDLLGCYMVANFMRMTSYLLTSMNFGKSTGVVESFGIFKKRIENLHNENIQESKTGLRSNNYIEPYIDYYATPKYLGDEYHRHLLKYYWESYVTRSDSKIRGISPMPSIKTKLPTLIPTQVIPYMDVKSCIFEDDTPYYAPTALVALTKHFKSAVLTHVEWKVLISKGVKGYYEIINKTMSNLEAPLSLIIDYTDWLHYNDLIPGFTGCDYNWAEVENELNVLNRVTAYPTANLEVTTLIFGVAKQTDETYSVNVDVRFAKRMSSYLSIGCAFQLKSFVALNQSARAAAAVEACKNVNGSVYTLQTRFQLHSSLRNAIDNSSNHFYVVVRPKLEEMKQIRRDILLLHREATVYFQLRFRLLIIDNHATPFCNSEALGVNENIEAIVNWATLNGIPLIFGRSFADISPRHDQTWFSVLRSIETNTNYYNPYFVFRNYPKIFKDMVVEPCVDWTIKRPTVTESYFHNNYFGLFFYPKFLRKENPISLEEYKILLQFMLQRFDLVEVRIGRDNYKDFLNAVHTMALEGLIGSEKRFLIDFDTDETTDNDKLQVFETFLNYTKTKLAANTILLKGITFLWGDFRSNNKENSLKASTLRNTMVLRWGRNLNLTLGISMSISSCHGLFMDSILISNLRTDTDNLLSTAGHIMCSENVEADKYTNPKSLGKLLDKHLYFKKAMSEFYPHLNIYFRLFVIVTLTEATLHDYLILLSNFKNFAAIYNISYIMVDAFDGTFSWESGWWKISNFSNLALPLVFEEKYSAFVGAQTWRPPIHPKLISINEEKNNNLVLFAVGSGLGLLIVALALGLLYYKNRVSPKISDVDENEFRNGKQGNADEQASGQSEYLKFDSKYELTLADIYIDPKDLLGRGNFGTVYKGLVREEPVAIKQPNENCSAISFKSVLCEIKVLCYVGTHPNVVRFIGAYTKEIRKGILYIATELCSNGSLLDLLREKKRVVLNMGDGGTDGMEENDALDSRDLHRFSKEIASGMDYIAGKHVIHGDLSARNVLLDENLTCKIGDFGLSRKLYEYMEYVKKSQEPLPWKWIAYEGLASMEFTSKSDVWSYGVTLWEIYSLGKVPYGGLAWTTGFADELKNGLRLHMPEFATEEIYKTMSNCWNLNADERPTFEDIVQFYKQLSSSDYTVMEL